MAPHPRLPAPPPLASLLEQGRVALFLDFDGTLVEIASGPDVIIVPERLAGGLQRLSDRLGGALALVTGRSIDNLHQFLGPLQLHLAGSHGGHVLAPDEAALREAEPLPEPVTNALAGFAASFGLLFERKAHGGALHYRARPELEDETHSFAIGLAEAHGLATKAGKCVIELVWPGADKGGAVDLLIGQPPFAGAMPVFIGDDVTDEDGFAACARLGGFGIAVGERPSTAARYSLASVKDVHFWLDL
ncbi:trehalose-phosphatase [Erythrobacter sanguineus]|uniref:Trehalose 6-phosphate phosphatase n=1 Tax=Erythrobacter sanguineus TaxID=198312 RepID=A0A1M7SJ64_9SPHN|nr:trehalose-phosphatase [Erythrobacter sanguineus]SHN58506.1 trehalose 6-phosphatase [Erythrobacter sanguineus]